MSYLKFDKTQLVNLEYSLPKEILIANQLGAYCNSSIVGCNTRKYHGLLVVPIKEIDGGRHVLLSTLHETIIQHNQDFNLGINKYPGEYSPKGHKYARWVETDPVFKIVYRVGGVVIQKEILLEESESRLHIRYTLQEATSPTVLRLKPFVAFRNIHKLSHANMYANSRTESIPNGFKIRLYSEYPELFMQTSKKSKFVVAPDWYYQVEYSKEKIRGYDFREDLFVPGYFEMTIRKGESVVFTAGLCQVTPNQIKRRFGKVFESRSSWTSFEDVLRDSALKYIQKRGENYEILSGFPWFGRWGRHLFIALPGLLLTQGKFELAEKILLGMSRRLRGGLFPDHSPDVNNPVYGTADTSLWFIWAVQQYALATGDKKKAFKLFGEVINDILDAYSENQIDGIELHENGLIHAFVEGKALTWMDSYIDGQPVTQRPGYVVEVNAMWYNALCFALEGAKIQKSELRIKKLTNLIEKAGNSFIDTFWDESKAYLADYVFNGEADWDVRPNQIFAAAFPYSPLNEEQRKSVLDLLTRELLTPKGLRTLSPRSENFKQSYEGDHNKRDLSYHQGTVWPWLFGFFAEAWLKLHEDQGKEFIMKIVQGFEEDMTEHGVCNISEVYDGSPPHRACGAISFASSVAELLRVINILSNKSSN